MNKSSEECQDTGTYKKTHRSGHKGFKDTHTMEANLEGAECIGFIVASVIHAFVCADKIHLKPCT